MLCLQGSVISKSDQFQGFKSIFSPHFFPIVYFPEALMQTLTQRPGLPSSKTEEFLQH